MYSVPRSTPRTADAAEAVDEKRKNRPSSIAAGDKLFRRRPGGAMLCSRGARELRCDLKVGCCEHRGGSDGGRKLASEIQDAGRQRKKTERNISQRSKEVGKVCSTVVHAA